MKSNKYAKRDFLPSYLPHNRKEVFFDVIKMRWKLLLLIGILLTASLLPTILISLFKKIIAFNIIQIQGVDATLIANDLIACSLYILFLPIFGFVLAGSMRIIRELVWQEGVIFKDDFRIGVKQNYGQYVAILIIFSFFYLLAVFVLDIVNVFLVQYLPLVILFIVITPVMMTMINLVPIYDHKVGKNIAFAFKFLLLKPHIVIPLSLLISGMIIFVVFVPDLAMNYFGSVGLFITYGIFILSIIFIFPLMALFIFLVHNHLFDEYINKEQHQDIYKKGIETFEDSINNEN